MEQRGQTIRATVSRGDGGAVTEAEVILETHAPEDTERLGEVLATLLKGSGGTIALRGELSAGKTCLVRGMARAVSGEHGIHSPTFTLVNEYGEENKLFHMDLYRLDSYAEIAELGCEELFDSEHLCAVEWADRAEALLPERRVDVHLEHAGGDRRRIAIHDRGLCPPGWRETVGNRRLNMKSEG